LPMRGESEPQFRKLVRTGLVVRDNQLYMVKLGQYERLRGRGRSSQAKHDKCILHFAKTPLDGSP
jgi:hypothetical protein